MPGGFEAAEHPAPGVYRLLEESATARPSPVLTIGLVDVERARALTMALVLGPAGRLRRRLRTRTALTTWMHDRDKCWLVVNGGQGRLKATPELEAAAHPLLPVRALGDDLASGLAAARVAESFTVRPLGGADVTGSVHDLGDQVELCFTSAAAQWFVRLAPGDAEDAALLRRPFPRIITPREVVPGDPVVTDTADAPRWPVARAYLAAAIGAG